MKNQLRRLKTQFDTHAHNDEVKIFELKKQIFHGDIQFSQNNDVQIKNQFAIKPFDIDFLQSLSLKDDPKFREIRKIFLEYNETALKYNGKAANGLHLKTVVMDSMLKFMRMMFLAPDQRARKTILDVAYSWFLKHLNPKSQRTKGQLQQEIKKIMRQKGLLDKSDAFLPSQKQKDQLYDYRTRTRTAHKEYDAPYFQLDQYHTRKTYLTDRFQNQLRPQVSLMSKLRLKFPKPIPPKQVVQIPLPQPIPLESLVAVNPPNIAPIDPVVQQHIVEDFGLDPQAEDIVEEAPQQPQDPKRGELDPFVKVFALGQLRQREEREKETTPSALLHLRILYSKKQAQERIDQSSAKVMSDWAAARSRLKTQIARRIEASRVKEHLNRTVGSKSVEKAAGTLKVNQTIKEARECFARQANKEHLNTQKGLSFYDRRRIKTQQNHQKLSEILENNSRANKREEYINELEAIRARLQKVSKYQSFNVLKEGIMQLAQPADQDRPLKIEYPCNLPSNPFLAAKKKKKKKGKKKK